MTYNVKTAASMLGRSQTFVIERANRLKLRPPEMLCKHWNLTLDDIKKIQEMKPKVRANNMMLVAKNTGLTYDVVRKLASDCGLSFKRDYESIIFVCELSKTKYFTLRGILHYLQIWLETGDSPLKGIKARI